ncbi:hypothetical protein P9D53_18030 [Bacillus haynesii]|uniref:hypothetical protein n=1 Tax=Bacillus haynesii TaxID=1925021 RepID=UPI002281B40C|nr:hypothetical protein [Bacillus haynesii]MCY8543670.1 hypothetical protein [Bacillus haynesii]MEC1360162.1 hypothetical protein [Bacillus haynesii]
MNRDKEVFSKAKKMATIVKEYKNDEEVLSFLFRQDSLTLNQLKVYYTDSGFTSSMFMKTGMACSVAAMTLTSLFLIQAEKLFPKMPYIVLIFELFVLSCILWLLLIFFKAQKNPIQLTSHFKRKSEFARIAKMIDYVLDKKYKDAFKHK